MQQPAHIRLARDQDLQQRALAIDGHQRLANRVSVWRHGPPVLGRRHPRDAGFAASPGCDGRAVADDAALARAPDVRAQRLPVPSAHVACEVGRQAQATLGQPEPGQAEASQRQVLADRQARGLAGEVDVEPRQPAYVDDQRRQPHQLAGHLPQSHLGASETQSAGTFAGAAQLPAAIPLGIPARPRAAPPTRV